MRWTRVVAVLGAVVAACQFHTNPGTGTIDGGIDGPLPLPDAGPCLGISSSCANADTLRACAGSGAQPVDTTCSWGCVATGSAHCGVLVPTGSAVATADLDPTGLSPLDLQGTVDGNNGSISGSLRAMGSGVISGIDYHLVNGVAVFRVASLHVVGATVMRGDHPIAFVSDGDITIDGTIDLQGGCTGGTAGPGGHVGAAHGGNAAGHGGGKAGGGSHDMCIGGGGGGDAGSGGSGGNATIAMTAGDGGAPFGDDLITVLEGGGGGGGGGGGAGGFGGGGGGALQLVSNGTIAVNSVINAGGCGGQPGMDCGGGGGAGGAILIEGRTVGVSGTIAVNGGGGGGGDTGSTAGSNGQPARDQAIGGRAAGGQSGGSGGSGAAAGISDGAPGGIELNGGGGAGGIGRIRINTKSGTAMTGGTLSPAPADGTHASVGSAAVQ